MFHSIYNLFIIMYNILTGSQEVTGSSPVCSTNIQSTLIQALTNLIRVLFVYFKPKYMVILDLNSSLFNHFCPHLPTNVSLMFHSVKHCTDISYVLI